MSSVADSRPATSLDDLHAELGALRADVANMRSLLEKALQATPAREWLDVEEAAKLAERTPQTIRAWCGVENIGVQVRGKWRVDRAGLRRALLVRLDDDASRLPEGLR